MVQNINHVLVAVSSWQEESVKYRRHRLAEYLSKDEQTEKVYWVHSVNALPLSVRNYREAFKELKNGFRDINDKIVQFGLPDLIPGFFQRMYRFLQGKGYRELREKINDIDGQKILWFTGPWYPFIADMTEWDKIVYDCSDLWSYPLDKSVSMSSRLSSFFKGKTEKRIIKSSNIIFTTSDYLASFVEKKTNCPVITIENGVDYSLFQEELNSAADMLHHVPRPRLGFVGSMKTKIDFLLLGELADRHSDYNIILIGPSPIEINRDFETIIGKENIYWCGGIRPEAVPAYMRCLDVGLLPYKEIEYNRAVFPLKLFEYLAAGLPVAGCGLPSTEKYCADGIYLHVKRGSFVKACEETLAWGRDEGVFNRRIKLARQASWDEKFIFMLDQVLSSTNCI